MVYKVRAKPSRSGGRITSDVSFKKKKNAKKFADETNKLRPGSNARVIKG